ncbi:MAG: glycosyltransferase [Alphaproteobacteria bacterium]|nr:glycosyltransferase [Alphaproteobacteria bacterium]
MSRVLRRALFSVCAPRSLARATTLLASAERFLPGHDLFLIAAAAAPPPFPPRRLPARCRVLTPPDLAVKDIDVRRRIYDARAFCAAIAPDMFLWLFAEGYDEVLRFDADARLFAPPDEIAAAWGAAAEMVATPRHGSRDGPLNPGFLGLRGSATTAMALDRWRAQAAAGDAGSADPAVMERLAALVPAHHVIGHPGYAVGDWNLQERPLSFADGRYMAGGAPLVFFHFANVGVFAGDETPHPRPTGTGPTRRIAREYARELLGNGELDYALLPYEYDRPGGSIRACDLVRRALRRAVAEVRAEFDGTDLDRPDFLTRPVAAAGAGRPAPRLLHLLARSADTPPELRRDIAAFLAADGGGRAGLVGGLLQALHRHGAIDVRAVEALEESGPAADLEAQPSDPNRDLLAGTRPIAVDGIEGAATLPVLLVFIHYTHPDLAARFPLGTRAGVVSLVAWFASFGAAHYGLSDAAIEAMAEVLDQPFAGPRGEGEPSPLTAALAALLDPSATGEPDTEAVAAAAILHGSAGVRAPPLRTIVRWWLWKPDPDGGPRILRVAARSARVRAALAGTHASPAPDRPIMDAALAARGLGGLRSPPVSAPSRAAADGARRDLGNVVIGPFSAVSGLGASARLLAGLLRMAMDPVANVDMMAGRTETLRLADARARFLLLHVTADLTFDAVVKFAGLWRHAERRVAYWYWELPQMSRRMAAAAAALDEIWVASEHVRRAVAPAVAVPVRVIPPPIDPALYRPTNAIGGSFGAGKRGFRFLAVIDGRSYFARKNPDGVLRSFRKAFPAGDEPVELVVKLLNGHHDAAAYAAFHAGVGRDQRVRVIDGGLTQIEMNDLYQSADCFVSLHRAEGLGLGIVQAMMRGKAVIATGYSAPMDFLNADNALLVPYESVPVAAGGYPDWMGQTWAAPDETAAARYMKELAGRPEIAAAIGGRAAADAARHFAPARIHAVLRREAGI